MFTVFNIESFEHTFWTQRQHQNQKFYSDTQKDGYVLLNSDEL